jgi:putative ABC transport system permease protein
MGDALSQLRYTVRLLLKSPGFTITAALILGFGIGANTAVFSLIDAVILKSLPYPHSDRLVQISQSRQGSPDRWVDYPDYQDFCTTQRSFSDLAVLRGWHFDLSGQGDPVRLTGGYASTSFFEVFRTPLLLGRPFTNEEDKPNGPLVAVLNERLWRDRFNADPKIIGTTITLDNQVLQVVGIAPAQIEDWTAGLDVLLPLNAISAFGERHLLEQRALHRLDCFGRLKAGVTLDQAQADSETIQRNLANQYPDTDKGYEIRLVPLLDSSVNDYSSTLWLLGAAVVCLWLIANANIGNLFFARALERRREITIRATLGASRLRLAGQLMLESSFLSVFGGLIGLLVAVWAISLIKVLSPQQDLARFQRVSLDAGALLFFFGTTIFTSLLFGLLPAWCWSKANLGSGLKDETTRGGTAGPRRQKIQSLLMIVQVAVSCVLLIGANLLARSFQTMQTIPLGFNPNHLLAIQIELPSIRYKSEGRSLTFFETLLENVRHLPQVSAAALNPDPPFNDWNAAEPFGVPGRPDPEAGKEPTLEWQDVTPGYFRTLEIPLLAGRDFDDRDLHGNSRVVIVDEALAQRYFPGQNPIGKEISDFDDRYGEERHYYTIVGVARKVRHERPDVEQTAFQAYFPFARSLRDGILLVRSEGDPGALIPVVRKVVASIDPTVALSKVNTFDDWIAKKYVTRRLAMLLVSVFFTVALLLSVVGLYAVLAYSVGQRTREIGVRIALGARSSKILGLVIQQGLMLVGIGLVVGIAAAQVLVRLIDSVLYGVSATDPISISTSVFVLGPTAILACLFPALRATRIDPITVLRE